MYEPSLYRGDDGSRPFFDCRVESYSTSGFRSSIGRCGHSFKVCGYGALQVDNTFQIPEEKEKLKQTEILIIGGGAVDKALEEKIRNLSNAVYSTYGMTETLSHIALRRLNGAAASDRYYPFSSVELFLSSENTLMINAPLVCDDTLQTNDIARIYPDGSFTILGRNDNVINSGGIKVQAEEIEKLLHRLFLSRL